MAIGYSLSIGLNYVDLDHYGWDGKLNAPEKDATDIRVLADSVGFKSDIILSREATRENVIAAIENAASNLRSGDIFLLYYSGHGGQLPDLDGDEDDGVDETWCLFNGQLMDDQIKQMWTKFEEDVRVFMISDSCHSGTVAKVIHEVESRRWRIVSGNIMDVDHYNTIKAMPNNVALNTYMKNKAFYDKYINDVDANKHKFDKNVESKIVSNIRLISGCQDNQLSYDGPFNSAFTEKIITVWNGGKFKGNYSKFHIEIQNLLPSKQSPNHLIFGKQNLTYNLQIPFTI